MPLPRGASRVPGSGGERVQLASGEIVTRSTARTMGAREMGYRSERQRQHLGTGDEKHFQSFLRTEQGQHAIQVAQQRAAEQGIPFRRDDVKIDFIAARNARPHPGSGNQGSGPYYEFMEEYDLIDMEPYDIGDS